MAATVNVNGRISPEHDAVISVFDHGFLYGEGVYETLRTQGDQQSLLPAMQTRDTLYDVLDYHTFEKQLDRNQ